MDELKNDETQAPAVDVASIIRQAIEAFTEKEKARNEPAYKAELQEERRRREQLERRLNELVEENARSKQIAEEAQTSSVIRSELQRLGVSKVDLAFKAVRDDIVRGEDGRLLARSEGGETTSVKDYLAGFVAANPEFLPARISGGSGVTPSQKVGASGGSVDLDRIKPGMSREEMERVRQEIVRLASQPKGM